MNDVINVLEVYRASYEKLLKENKFDNPREWAYFNSLRVHFGDAIKILKEHIKPPEDMDI